MRTTRGFPAVIRSCRYLFTVAVFAASAPCVGEVTTPGANLNPMLGCISDYLTGGVDASSSFVVTDLGSNAAFVIAKLTSTTDFVVTSVGSTVGLAASTLERAAVVLPVGLKLDAFIGGAVDSAGVF